MPLSPQKKRERKAYADELGQGQVDEDYPPLQDVDAEIGVDHDKQETGQKRIQKKIKRFHDLHNDSLISCPFFLQNGQTVFRQLLEQ